MKSPDYLDALRAKLNLPSDYAIAKRFKVTTATVSGWRAGGRRTPSPLTCFAIAELLEIDPQVVIADMELQRAEQLGDETQATAWKHWVEKLGGIAACLALGTVLSAPAPANASMKTTPPGAADAVHYVNK